MPLQRRVPKLKGFTNPNREEFAVVNVELPGASYYADGEVTPEALYAARPGPQGPPGEGARAAARSTTR